MTFNDNKSIYEQIVDFGYARVISGDWPEEGPAARHGIFYLRQRQGTRARRSPA